MYDIIYIYNNGKQSTNKETKTMKKIFFKNNFEQLHWHKREDYS